MENHTVKVGQKFLLHAQIRNAQNAYSFEMYLIYPDNVIEIEKESGKPKIIKGDFLGDGGDLMSDYSINPTNDTATITVAYSLAGNVAGQDGDGRLFSLRATALTAGEYSFIWAPNSTIFDPDGGERPKNFEELKLMIEKENPDINVVFLTIEPEE